MSGGFVHLRARTDYRDHAVIVEGYFFQQRQPQGPTVLDLMSR